MNDIKNSLIKIAYQNPNLRKDLVKVLQQANNKKEAIKGIIKLAYVNPEIREYALPLIKKEGGIKDIKRKLEQAQIKKQKKEQQKNKSQIPQNVMDAAKNESYGNIALKEYMTTELKNQKLKNPALKRNPNAQKEVAVSTVLNHAADPKDPLNEDSKQILKPYLEAIIKAEGEEETKGEDTAEVKEQPKTVDGGSPQSIVQNSEANLESKLDEKITEEVYELNNEDLKEFEDNIADEHLNETVTGLFENLGVPNAHEVGDAVVEARKEEKEVNDQIEKAKKDKDEFDRKVKHIDVANRIGFFLGMKDTYRDLVREALEDAKGMKPYEYPDIEPEELEKKFKDFEENPTLDKAKELLSLQPDSSIGVIRDNLERETKRVEYATKIVETELTDLWIDDWNDEVLDQTLQSANPKDTDEFINSYDEDKGKELSQKAEDLVENPTIETFSEIINELPQTVSDFIVFDVAENGVNEETPKEVAVAVLNTVNAMDGHQSLQSENEEQTEEQNKEKVKSLKDRLMGAFRDAKDFVKYRGLVAGDSKKDADAYLKGKGFSLDDLKGEKRDEALKAMDEYKSIHETKKLLPSNKQFDNDQILELSKLKGKLKDKEFKAIIDDVTNDDFDGFKKSLEERVNTKEQAKEMGLENDKFDEEETKKLNEIHDQLKELKIDPKTKRELAKEYIKGDLKKEDIELFKKMKSGEIPEMGTGSEIDKFKALKNHTEKQNLIKDYAKKQTYKDETQVGSPDISYDEIVELSEKGDETDKKWALKKLKSIEKDYDKDLVNKAQLKKKEREDIEKLFQPEKEGDPPLRLKGPDGKKYTIHDIYDMVSDPSNPKNKEWASKQLDELKKSVSGELEADEKEIAVEREKEEKIKQEKKEKGLHTQKETLNKKLEKDKRKIDDTHKTKVQEIEKEHEEKRKSTTDAVKSDIEKAEREANDKIKQKEDEINTKIHEKLKSSGFDIDSKKKEIDEKHKQDLTNLLGVDDPDKFAQIEENKKKGHDALEKEKQDKISQDPELKKLKQEQDTHKKGILGPLARKKKRKEDALKKELDSLEGEKKSAISSLEEKTKEEHKKYESEHQDKVNEIDKHLGIETKKAPNSKEISETIKSEIPQSIPKKQRENLTDDIEDYFSDLDLNATDSEIEDQTNAFISNNMGKGNFKGIPQDIVNGMFRVFLQSMNQGTAPEVESPKAKKQAPKKTKKPDEVSTYKTPEESMTDYFEGKDFSYTHTYASGRTVNVSIDFEELLKRYKVTKMEKKNPYTPKTTEEIQKLYEDAKKEYESYKKQNKKASVTNNKAEEIKQRIREKSRFDEKDFEELKPFFGDDLKFDKDKYLESKKQGLNEKRKQIESDKTRIELEKTKMEMKQLKDQMRLLSKSKQASIKKKLVKIALNSKKEIRDIILPMI